MLIKHYSTTSALAFKSLKFPLKFKKCCITRATGFGPQKPAPKQEDETKQQQVNLSTAVDDLEIEERVLSRRKKKTPKQDLTNKDVSKKGLSNKDTFETYLVLTLASLLGLILLEGLFIGASGFFSDSLDKFATEIIYPVFTPTVGVFLAGSVYYGVWKTKQGKELQ